jgi:Zn-dependent peptidase ImmA (M78 family)
MTSAGISLMTDGEIAEKIVELVAWARQRYAVPEESTGRETCEALGLGLRRAQLPKGVDGLLTEDRLVVVGTDIAWTSRLEYTIFHEAVHHLLEEHGDLVEYFTDTLRGDDRAFKAAIERCCQAGAGEFMVPRHRVRECIARHGFSVDLVERLAGRHGASIVASAIQVATYAPVDCYVAVCSYGVSPRFWPPNQTLYVDQAAMRPGMRYPWARCAPIPPDHLFHRVWENKRRMDGPSFVPFPHSGQRKPCEHAEAKPLGDRVVGILYDGHPPRKGQLGLNLALP